MLEFTEQEVKICKFYRRKPIKINSGTNFTVTIGKDHFTVYNNAYLGELMQNSSKIIYSYIRTREGYHDHIV